MKIVGTRASGKPSWLVPGFVLIVAMASLIGVGSSASAATGPVPLGTAANFAVLAGSTVTSTGPAIIDGDLGLSPGTSVTGFPPGQVNGTIHAADSLAAQAQADLTSAYDDAAARPVTVGSSATLGTNSALQGNVLALTSITVTTGTTIDGRALALNGAVTLDTDTITAPIPALIPALTITKTADTRIAADDRARSGGRAGSGHV